MGRDKFVWLLLGSRSNQVHKFLGNLAELSDLRITAESHAPLRGETEGKAEPAQKVYIIGVLPERLAETARGLLVMAAPEMRPALEAVSQRAIYKSCPLELLDSIP